MDINNVLRRILNERGSEERTARGLNYKDTASVLEGAINSCSGLAFLKGKKIKQITPTYPVDNNIPLMYKFPDLFNMRPEAVAYAGGQIGNEFVVVFGVVDPKVSERALLAYSVKEGGSAQRLADGAGMKCPYLQKFESYGQANLSEYNQAILQSFLNKYGSIYTVSDSGNMQNYKKVPMRELRHNGKPLDWEGDPQGYVWQKVEGGSQQFLDNAEETDKAMKAQGFTDVQPSDPVLLSLGFTLNAVKDSVATLGIDPNQTTSKAYWPTRNAEGIILNPTPEQCRDTIRTLKACKNKKESDDVCLNNLVQRKLNAMRCDKAGSFKLGGMFGLQDDFDKMITDPTKFGLGNLAPVLGTVSMGKITTESTLEKRINKVLNEQHRKFSFNPKPKINVDKNLIDTLAMKLVMEAYYDLKRSNKKLKRLNENAMSDTLGALGYNLKDSLFQSTKEIVAKKIIQFLGVDPDTFTGLFLINLFANIEIKRIFDVINNCEEFTPEIVKAALEAWLDLAIIKVSGDKFQGFIGKSIKNMVTQSASNTTVFKHLESLAISTACPIIESIGEGIKSGDLEIF